MTYTLINSASGATKGNFNSKEVAENYRMKLDDWWLWEVIRWDEI